MKNVTLRSSSKKNSSYVPGYGWRCAHRAEKRKPCNGGNEVEDPVGSATRIVVPRK